MILLRWVLVHRHGGGEGNAGGHIAAAPEGAFEHRDAQRPEVIAHVSDPLESAGVHVEACAGCAPRRGLNKVVAGGE